MRMVLFAAALAAAGCVDSGTGSSEQRGEVDDYDCECKIEGSAIGQVGARVYAGDEIVTFVEWIPKAGSAGEYAGFVLSNNAGSVSYVVKAGTESYPATGDTWMNPYGDSGPEVKGISNVDFCEDDDYPPDDGGDGEDPPPDEEDPVVN
jgi:hypothetical protein